MAAVSEVKQRVWAICLRLPEVEGAELLADAYRHIAPACLVARLDSK